MFSEETKLIIYQVTISSISECGEGDFTIVSMRVFTIENTNGKGI
jgi:hypothetical protein